jgi:hypothetical protein
MNEMKQLCERIVADAPPMPDSAGVLATARRQTTRYRLVQLAAGGAAVVVVAAGALTVSGTDFFGRAEHGTSFGAPASPTASQPASPTASPTASPSSSRVGGAAPGQGTNANRMSELLASAVPGGYTVSPMGGSAGMFGAFDVAQHSAGMWVADGHGRGQLGAAIVQPPAGTELSEPSHQCQDPAPVCEVVRVGDVTVLVDTGKTEGVGQNISAWRWLSVGQGGGYLVIWAHQGFTEYPDGMAPVVHPGLRVFPFTKQQLAELAANAEMLPPAMR